MSDCIPTLAGFNDFIRTFMGIDTGNLPDDSVYISTAYKNSCHWVSLTIASADAYLYTQAIYNLGGDFLLNIAQDPANAPVIYGNPPMTYFNNIRRQMNLNGLTSGVVQSASDEGTSTGLLVPNFFSSLTLSDLQRLKTPYGRVYLEIAQNIGTLWGLS